MTYPRCNVVGVEYEPVMITMAKKWFLHDMPDHRFDLVHCNAADFISRRDSEAVFDVIVSDIFYNTGLPHDIYASGYIDGIRDALSGDGFAIFNLCGMEASHACGYFDRFRESFGFCEILVMRAKDLVVVAGRRKQAIQESLRRNRIRDWQLDDVHTELGFRSRTSAGFVRSGGIATKGT